MNNETAGESKYCEVIEAIRSHWKHRGDLENIESALSRRGIDPLKATPEQLSAHDQLHTGGLEGTRLFAEWVGVTSKEPVLDIGAGLGGSARYLTHHFGCSVTALELCPELVETARELTRRHNLQTFVSHLCRDVTLPPANDSWEKEFELVWIQHTDIHIQDKYGFYSNCREWLHPEGRIVWHDWVLGPRKGPLYPVPWSKTGEISFLVGEKELRKILNRSGLRITRFQNENEQAKKHFLMSRERIRRAYSRRLQEGYTNDDKRLIHLAGLEQDANNVVRNIEEGRIISFYAEARCHKS